MHLATSDFLLLVVMPGATFVAFLLLVIPISKKSAQGTPRRPRNPRKRHRRRRRHADLPGGSHRVFRRRSVGSPMLQGPQFLGRRTWCCFYTPKFPGSQAQRIWRSSARHTNVQQFWLNRHLQDRGLVLHYLPLRAAPCSSGAVISGISWPVLPSEPTQLLWPSSCPATALSQIGATLLSVTKRIAGTIPTTFHPASFQSIESRPLQKNKWPRATLACIKREVLCFDRRESLPHCVQIQQANLFCPVVHLLSGCQWWQWWLVTRNAWPEMEGPRFHTGHILRSRRSEAGACSASSSVWPFGSRRRHKKEEGNSLSQKETPTLWPRMEQIFKIHFPPTLVSTPPF